MSKLLATIAFFFVVITGVGQKPADIQVSYDFRFPGVSGGERTHKMTLLANTVGSKYFNDISLWTDSLNSTPEGAAKLNEIIRASCLVQSPEGYEYWDFTKGPVKDIYIYVFNNVADETLIVYDKWGEDLGFYSEPANEMQWTIVSDSLNTILGYECVMARTDYHGRLWTVWFAPDIPLSYGPWKLRGLPGLIMEASADGGFSFRATGLSSSCRLITPIYSAADYGKTDRKKAQANNEYFVNNREAILKAQNGGMAKITYTDSEGNEIPAPVYEAKKHSLEPDYTAE